MQLDVAMASLLDVLFGVAQVVLLDVVQVALLAGSNQVRLDVECGASRTL